MHVDTGHNFPEVLEFRDRRVSELGERLIVASVQESIDTGRATEEGESRNRLQTVTLLDAIAEPQLRRRVRRRPPRRGARPGEGADVLLPRRARPVGPARPAARAVERLQRRGRARRARARFPLSNWTELDIWSYIREERLEIPSIYFAHEREVFERDGMLLAVSEWLEPRDGEEVVVKSVRYRTVGDMTITGAVESDAADVDAVIEETKATRLTERGQTRADDRASEASMEDRKREGYF